MEDPHRLAENARFWIAAKTEHRDISSMVVPPRSGSALRTSRQLPHPGRRGSEVFHAVESASQRVYGTMIAIDADVRSWRGPVRPPQRRRIRVLSAQTRARRVPGRVMIRPDVSASGLHSLRESVRPVRNST